LVPKQQNKFDLVQILKLSNEMLVLF
jgi:hypothetical protein